MDNTSLEDLIRELRIEATLCGQSAQHNGEYNQAFHVVSIVLMNLVRRLQAAQQTEPDHG